MGAALARHPGDNGLMPWAFRVLPQPDESLSSWLVRAALLQACDPMTLTGVVWPKWRVWTIDTDRGIAPDRLAALSRASGIAPERFGRAFLRPTAGIVAGRALADTQAWPWVLALGSRNRGRKGGQQFCPACLAEDKRPYYRRHWRFAWHVACARHGTVLADRCGVCGAPIVFHRLVAGDRGLAFCAHCRADLRTTTCITAESDAMAFQMMADTVVALNVGTLWGQVSSAAEWFSAARVLVGAVRSAGRRPVSGMARAFRGLGVSISGKVVPGTGLSLELLSTRERSTLIGAALSLMRADVSALVERLRSEAVTIAALQGEAPSLPAPLAFLTSWLPNGRRGGKRCHGRVQRVPQSERAVVAKWARLRRRMRVSPF